MTPRETAQSGIRSRSTKLTILDDITGLRLDNLSMVQVSIGVVSSAGGHQEHASVSLRERRLSPSASRIVLENHIALHHAVETTPVQAVESDSHPHNSTIFRCTPGHRQAREGFSSPGLSVKKQESFGYSSTSNRLSNCLLPFFQGLVPGRLFPRQQCLVTVPGWGSRERRRSEEEVRREGATCNSSTSPWRFVLVLRPGRLRKSVLLQ